jgi:hypothetical protein
MEMRVQQLGRDERDRQRHENEPRQADASRVTIFGVAVIHRLQSCPHRWRSNPSARAKFLVLRRPCGLCRAQQADLTRYRADDATQGGRPGRGTCSGGRRAHRVRVQSIDREHCVDKFELVGPVGQVGEEGRRGEARQLVPEAEGQSAPEELEEAEELEQLQQREQLDCLELTLSRAPRACSGSGEAGRRRCRAPCAARPRTR